MRKLFLILIAVTAQPALAHPGEHHANIVASLWHFLTQPDHLAFAAILLIVGISAIVLARRRALRSIRSKHHDPR
ncbi:MAG: HupE/UreJ family protein [Rhodocyclaceae bacterium]|jgi:hydrogenase/urease accessory protein HupE|nr:HupE/UreJ family protein [Rhodocyclaceae bacterium]MBL0074596.1 HupE/UreJ family protein [Rhodocyclaceae bacterium]MBP7082043.1 HupE/UreJ family protein [Rhodocyclaceae bacterium]